MKKFVLAGVALCIAQAVPAATSIDDVFKNFDQQGKLSFSAERGDQFWHKKNIGDDGKERTCSTCHGTDLTKSGKHIKTGKVIDPMAPSVNKERLTDLKKIEKWFKRNCKWTIGRECTDQEKGDVLKYLSKL